MVLGFELVGRTVSGNAAPCRRNLESWIRAHPGWEAKSEEQLSSSRRIKGSNRPGGYHPSLPPSGTPSATATAAHGASTDVIAAATAVAKLSSSTPPFPNARDIAESLIMLSQSPLPASGWQENQKRTHTHTHKHKFLPPISPYQKPLLAFFLLLLCQFLHPLPSSSHFSANP